MTEPTLPADDVEVGPETPVADAVEQAVPTTIEDAETPRDIVHIPDEVPEADALEQAYEVELGDEY